ncbi:RNA-guided endonuclease IscB [Streptomyces chartreusis]|uniref:RNA-guided endonuclease IscB n=1 Tax=Streptomyces chartreusis TaxID=1969 RepID=UPI0036DECFD7
MGPAPGSIGVTPRAPRRRRSRQRTGAVTLPCQSHRTAAGRARAEAANRRYRAPRSRNRTVPAGWLPPSLRHRVDTTVSMANRLCRYAPVTEIHMERAGFDTRPTSNGTLAGTDARAHLRIKWNNACAYCDITGVPLNIEHLTPRSRGGSSRISNLVLACVPCNKAKGTKPVETLLAHRPDRLARVLEQVEAPLHDAAAMNATCRQLSYALEAFGIPTQAWSARLTKTNRDAMQLGKTHTLDALSIGPLDHENGDAIVRFPGQVLVAKATGRGSYARTTPDRYGFPRLRRARIKQHFGYVTGDLVRACVPTG